MVIYQLIPFCCRTLGNFAGIMAERKNIHHSISSGLDSHDLVELEAAIAAAKMYAERSRCGTTRNVVSDHHHICSCLKRLWFHYMEKYEVPSC